MCPRWRVPVFLAWLMLAAPLLWACQAEGAAVASQGEEGEPAVEEAGPPPPPEDAAARLERTLKLEQEILRRLELVVQNQRRLEQRLAAVEERLESLEWDLRRLGTKLDDIGRKMDRWILAPGR